MLVPIALGVGALVMLTGRRGQPLSRARMERSSTASAHGIDNRIPARFEERARGLAIVGGQLEAQGLIVTSVYRSPMVNAVLYFVERNPGQSPDIASLTPRDTNHAQCRALDLGAGSSKLSPAAIKQRVMASSLARIVERTIDEGDHLHVDFSAAGLEQIGKRTT